MNAYWYNFAGIPIRGGYDIIENNEPTHPIWSAINIHITQKPSIPARIFLNLSKFKGLKEMMEDNL